MRQAAVFIGVLALVFGIPRTAWSEHTTTSSLRPALTLKGQWLVEAAAADPVNGVVWRTEASGPIDGGAFVQLRAFPLLEVKECVSKRDTTGICKRLRIRAEKPADKTAAFAVQFPGRTFAITAPPGSSVAEIVLNEISLGDIGQMAFHLNVEGGTKSSFGLIDLRTHEDEVKPAPLVALTSHGRILKDGDKIKHGWWFLFLGTADPVEGIQSPADLLSLCVLPPSGRMKCADGSRIKIRVREKGDHYFIAWTTELQFSVFRIVGV